MCERERERGREREREKTMKTRLNGNQLNSQREGLTIVRGCQARGLVRELPVKVTNVSLGSDCRFEGGLYPAIIQVVPVDAFEEHVLPNLLRISFSSSESERRGGEREEGEVEEGDGGGGGGGGGGDGEGGKGGGNGGRAAVLFAGATCEQSNIKGHFN